MDSFRFANPWVFWLLVAVVALIALFITARVSSHRALRRFGNVALLRTLMPGVSEGKLRLKFILEIVALVCLVLAAARPQFGSKLETVKKEGIEVMVCLDISNSMLAEDIAPSRLEKSKRMLSRLIDQLDNDQVGLIVFAGDAFTQLPITNDYVSAKMFLSTIDPKMVSIQGTAIGAAINLAVRSFTPNEASSKAIVVLTDGENHEDDAEGAAQAALEKGIHTHVIGVGSTQGSLVPDDSGRKGSYRKDREGNPITTRLDEEMARKVAAAGEGVYAHADASNSAVTAIVDALSKMQTSELESHVYADYDDKFVWFLWPAILLLLIDLFVLDRANALLSKVKLFGVLAVLSVLPSHALAQKEVRRAIRQGNDQYRSESYLDAELSYRKALEAGPNDSIATFNLANALFRQLDNKKMEEAMKQYMITADAAQRSGNKDLAAKSYYNAGDIMMSAQKYDEAIRLFKQSLKQNPLDDEARYNLLLAQRLLKQQQQQNQDQQQDQNQDDQKQQDQQQQQNDDPKEDQQQQNQDQQPQQNPEQQDQQQNQDQQQPQQQPQNQMSQEQAEAILEANNRDEKDTQERVQERQMQQIKQRHTGKDW